MGADYLAVSRGARGPDSESAADVADGIGWPVTAISTDTVTVDEAITGLTAGDEVLIINLHGSDSAHGSVGTYEFANVLAVSGATVTLAADLENIYGELSNDDLTDQAIVLQRVPNYASVSIGSGGALTTSAWDGETGGVLAFRVSGALTISSGGVMTVDSLGYAGGATGPSYNCDSYQGESYAGEGEGAGNGACSAYNEATGQWANNFGGGGAHITGGGGEYAGGATDGDSWDGGSATEPYAGESYGGATLSAMYFGSGGGGVWDGNPSCTGDGPGPGGDGGGLLFASAASITASGAAALSAIGGSSDHCAQGSWTYGAGGGAGGTIWLVANAVDLDDDAIYAPGGTGNSSNIRAGGDGGEGRVRVDCDTCNGYAGGDASAETALNAASEPDPGHIGAP